MKKSSDSIYRQWKLLQLIPRYPRRINAEELLRFLIDNGFDVAIRTIQRDLYKLSVIFMTLNKDSEGKKHYWFWDKDSIAHEFQSMSPETALAFQLSKSSLTSTLPPSMLELIQPHLKQSHEILSFTSTHLKNWPSKIAAIDNNINLIKPEINSEIQSIVYEGVFTEKQIKITYQPRNKEPIEYTVQPLGIVIRQGVIYLICTLWKYENIVQLALHRFVSAELLEANANLKEDFKLATYIEEQQPFDYPISSEAIQLKVLFSKAAAQHLYETPLMEEQSLSVQEDNRVLLEGSIIDSHKLHWWLAGFGSQIEVVEPASLRDLFVKEAELMMNNYSR